MQLENEYSDNLIISRLEDDQVIIGDNSYKIPLIIFNNQVLPMGDINKYPADVVLFGTGAKHLWLEKPQANVELMSNFAAVRVFNLLRTENRNVLLVLHDRETT